MQMHGFYLDRTEKTIKFDIIISFDAKNRHQIYKEILKEISEAYPEYDLQIQLDSDISD